MSHERWQQSWALLGTQAPAASYDALVRRYGEPHRAYHTLAHVLACLEELSPIADDLTRRGEVELALWYHDVVYEPRAADNEAQSAAMATAVLRDANLGDDQVAAVHGLIMATQTHQPDGHPDAAILLDCDLAILGADPPRFQRYEEAIRFEYNWVPEELYCRERSRILTTFCERPRIYQTPHFYALYEEQARQNLAGSIASLTA